MPLIDIIHNKVLIASIIASILAQILKLPLEYLRNKTWDWSLLFSTGGMPSSHSAIVSAATVSIGHYVGFDTPLFGLAFAVAAVVVYDATNIRRQAGFDAQQINRIIKELALQRNSSNCERFSGTPPPRRLAALSWASSSASFAGGSGLRTSHVIKSIGCNPLLCKRPNLCYPRFTCSQKDLNKITRCCSFCRSRKCPTSSAKASKS